ncbi:hypothetical protein T01_5841 [Trichinella spiralis]|uniref:Uncharacterized protein n=1 Tax=Trichinella spiralis TaxID=6334 RepID=A0A0V1B6T6_TRISP|nr:hypothetical protein T01_5841 [Trichinella spiralis]
MKQIEFFRRDQWTFSHLTEICNKHISSTYAANGRLMKIRRVEYVSKFFTLHYFHISKSESFKCSVLKILRYLTKGYNAGYVRSFLLIV